MSLLPGGEGVFGRRWAPLWRLGPSSRAVGELLEELRATERGALRFTFGRPSGAEHDGASTRYLGDLYQDLNEEVRKRYALLQTPEFVERFLLDGALGPALRERGIGVTVLDPACGSGHLLLGAYDRLFEARRAAQPGLSAEASARAALGQVFGVDLNPYAAAVARFRLVLSYLDKAGISRLDQVPGELPLQVYVGDSLLAGVEYQGTLGDALADKGVAEAPGFERSREAGFFHPETAALLRRKRFDVVVANPPYITEKDPVKREKIRDRYVAAAGKFALSAPFAERIFQLANDGGWTGQITSNSFMKREFGKKLVEEVLPKVDLTEVVDTSGAFIPGHDTPTVILFGRHQAPIASKVRVLMGTHGEPGTPERPEEGKVWGAIAAHYLDESYSDEFITVTAMDRDKLAKHTWSFAGGGGAELKDALEERAQRRLDELVESIGFGSFTGCDDVFVMDARSGPAAWVEPAALRPMITGDAVRDWTMVAGDLALTPYGQDALPLEARGTSRWMRHLWPFRTSLWGVVGFGGRSRKQNNEIWWHWYRWVPERYQSPLSIVFAFVATHNQFALDRGGKAFNRSAPIIKLPRGAPEEAHLALLGYLNSSVACFWMKQVSYPKASSVHDVDIERGKPENNRYEFTAAGLLKLPVHRPSAQWAQRLDAMAAERSGLRLDRVINDVTSTSDLLRSLDRMEQRHDQLTQLMVAVQEELDWTVYEAFALCESGQAQVVESPEDGVRPEHRPFAWENGQPPADLPPGVAARYRARRALIETNSNIRQIETPVYKRLWRGQQGVFGQNTLTFRERQLESLKEWLLDRLESALREQPTRRPQPIRALAQILHADPKVRAVAEVLTGTATFDLETLLADLASKEAVPTATCQRYTDKGIATRRAWEATWALQRREDAGEKVTIEVPPKYDQKDFENAAVLWRLRGKLDVPKERFLAYPTATPPPGASGKPALTFGWAGWNALQQLEAAIVLWQEEMDLHGHLLLSRATRASLEEKNENPSPDAAERLARDAAARDKLLPLLQTMVDLLPWVAQWHDEDGQTAREYEEYLSEEARKLEVSLDEAHLYRRPARQERSRPARGRSPRDTAPADPQEDHAQRLLAAARELDEGAGVPVSALAERLSLSAAAAKKLVDGLVDRGALVERKKRPRLVSAAPPPEQA
jgi:SAM-dependent methyltransferase